MKVTRAAGIPLITHDPYFSIWSCGDHLYDEDTKHWSGARQKLDGFICVDGECARFMGASKPDETVIPQTGLSVTPASTEYSFENSDVQLTVRFLSPLLLDDRRLLSRPCSYVDVQVLRKRKAHVTVTLRVSADLVTGMRFEQEKENEADAAKREQVELNGGAYTIGDIRYGMMGKADQTPLGHSGDHITIDWGYVYLAGRGSQTEISFDPAGRALEAVCDLRTDGCAAELILAYDDLLSINYFGNWLRGYWTKYAATIPEAIRDSFAEKKDVIARCDALDRKITEMAQKAGGEDYAFLCIMAYRHAIAAHKLVEDPEGNLLFLSKENDSNGCIGTVDVSYPSVPLFLLFDTEYVKGMLRPVFRFAQTPVWEADYAPHDVGRYPYAWGQVYGLKKEEGRQFSSRNGAVYPPYYQFPACGCYDLVYQMPVEECGNMLVMTALCCRLDESGDFAKPYMDLLQKWTEYLLRVGGDPGEQLCTDDFAGHLAHNTNLAVKAVMGIKAYALILEMNGRAQEAEEYRRQAETMINDWARRADAGDHYMLAFGHPESWSLKYNLVWDELLGEPYFPADVREKELRFYQKKCGPYGVPLDSRRSYTKSDWILWCAAMAKDVPTREALIGPVAEYLRRTASRVPFSDWYDTQTGRYEHFIARSVQGGIYMPCLMDRMRDEG